MERLTERYIPNDEKKGIAGIKVFESENKIPLIKILSGEYLYPAIEKLAEYEDLEEQNLLLKLPIPLNTTVYTIYTKQWCYYDDDCMEDIEYKCMNGEFCEKQEVRHYIHTEKFSASMINFINKTVFLNREDAEKKLEEMEHE
ncbi:hypothetical protein DW958_13815 [Ruminococcus sp. AM46-18]|jgi:hypothetical protein|nr:hypothetical protein DW958_13815 [Ruminococcus sp. AM46-18]